MESFNSLEDCLNVDAMVSKSSPADFDALLESILDFGEEPNNVLHAGIEPQQENTGINGSFPLNTNYWSPISDENLLDASPQAQFSWPSDVLMDRTYNQHFPGLSTHGTNTVLDNYIIPNIAFPIEVRVLVRYVIDRVPSINSSTQTKDLQPTETMGQEILQNFWALENSNQNTFEDKGGSLIDHESPWLALPMGDATKNGDKQRSTSESDVAEALKDAPKSPEETLERFNSYCSLSDPVGEGFSSNVIQCGEDNANTILSSGLPNLSGKDETQPEGHMDNPITLEDDTYPLCEDTTNNHSIDKDENSLVTRTLDTVMHENHAGYDAHSNEAKSSSSTPTNETEFESNDSNQDSNMAPPTRNNLRTSRSKRKRASEGSINWADPSWHSLLQLDVSSDIAQIKSTWEDLQTYLPHERLCDDSRYKDFSNILTTIADKWEKTHRMTPQCAARLETAWTMLKKATYTTPYQRKEIQKRQRIVDTHIRSFVEGVAVYDPIQSFPESLDRKDESKDEDYVEREVKRRC